MDIWTEDEVSSLGIIVPNWIDADIDLATLSAIEHGGCESGAYMPAVEYWSARQTMNQYGDDVLDYLFDIHGALPKIDDQESWSGIAVHFLSKAVEAWASSVLSELQNSGYGYD